jgi:hypothetical protein
VTERDDLEFLRQALFDALEVADVAAKAKIVGELRQVLKSLAQLPDTEGEMTVADEINARRTARRNAAGHPSSSAKRSQSRRSGGNNRAG